MQIGERWAYREPPHTPGKAAIPVEVLQFGPPRDERKRVRFLAGPYPGLEQWVTKKRLLVPWAEIDAFLNDEVRFAACAASVDVVDPTAADAALLVFACYSVANAMDLGPSGVFMISTLDTDLDTIGRDLGLDRAFFFADPLAYLDRNGAYVAPWPIGLALAQHMARVWAPRVLDAVRRDEQQMERAATEGEETTYGRKKTVDYRTADQCATLLHHYQPIFALVRAWCGETEVERFDEAEAMRAEVASLRRLVDEAGDWLTKAGHPRVAARLRKQAGIPPPRRFEMR